MVEKPDQIEKHIELTRNELGDNFRELEDNAKQAADWRTYFERSPTAAMGLALGGGVLLATMAGSKNGVNTPQLSEAPLMRLDAARNSYGGTQRNPVADTWDNLKSALIGFAAPKVRGMVRPDS